MNIKEKMRNTRGITLIALVVTIIVLIILAGVSISLVLGENGIIKKAQEARVITEKSSLEENVKLKILEYQMDNENNLEEILKRIEGATVEKVKEDTYYVTQGKAEVTVYEDGEIIEGKVEIWDGMSSKSPEFKEFNWYIYTPSQLKFLADYVNNGKTLTEEQEKLLTEEGYNPEDVTMTEDTIVYLMNYLDLGAREVNGEWETEENEALQWTAIGKTVDNTLVATFEGNENTIRGVYTNTDTNFNGIFGNSNSIKNLSIKNSYIKGATTTAGIVGQVNTIENCHNINTTVILIEGDYLKVGGVVGQVNTKASDCSNTGKIIGDGVYSNGEVTAAGGVIGSANTSTTISNCYNTGNVEGKGERVGGVVGNVNLSVTINNCYNTGNVEGTIGITGGVAGITFESTIISNCHNTGNITGNVIGIGGIVGDINGSGTISNCHNIGNVIGNGERIGGIAGNANTSTTISNCYNTGRVKGQRGIGGILGIMAANKTTLTSNCKVEKCYNVGEVNGEESVGGIVGLIAGSLGEGTVIQCYSKGKVIGTTLIGAMIGYQTNETGLNTLNNLYYLNTVGIGAINGEDDEINNIKSTTEDITSYEQFLNWIQNK